MGPKIVSHHVYCIMLLLQLALEGILHYISDKSFPFIHCWYAVQQSDFIDRLLFGLVVLIGLLL